MDYNPWFIMLLGMGTVFTGLFFLILIIKLISFLTSKGTKAEDAGVRTDAGQAAALPAYAAAAVPDRQLFDAVISAALAEYIGPEVAGLRIKSIRQRSAPQPYRGAFTAAISAAIATAMGESVQGIRIRSIKRV